MARGSISAAAACATAGLLLAVGASGATGAPISEGRALAQASPPIRDDDVIVSPEYAVADAVPSARRRTDEDPAVAWNGSEYLVVFTDSPIFTGDDDVYGMRLDADGNPSTRRRSRSPSAPKISPSLTSHGTAKTSSSSTRTARSRALTTTSSPRG